MHKEMCSTKDITRKKLALVYGQNRDLLSVNVKIATFYRQRTIGICIVSCIYISVRKHCVNFQSTSRNICM